MRQLICWHATKPCPWLRRRQSAPAFLGPRDGLGSSGRRRASVAGVVLLLGLGQLAHDRRRMIAAQLHLHRVGVGATAVAFDALHLAWALELHRVAATGDLDLSQVEGRAAERTSERATAATVGQRPSDATTGDTLPDNEFA